MRHATGFFVLLVFFSFLTLSAHKHSPRRRHGRCHQPCRRHLQRHHRSSSLPADVVARLRADAVAFARAVGLGDRVANMTLGGRAPLLPVANRTPTPTITNAEMWKSVSSRVGVPFGPVTGDGGVGAARAAVRAERAYDDDAEVVVDDVPIVTPASVRALRDTKGAVGRNIGFLTASGGRLALGGTAWSGAGANAYYLASLTAFGVSEAELVAQLGVHADAGATLLRVWFANDFAPRGTQPTLGVFNGAALARVDFVMAAAAAYGIRVIGVLSNYWPFAGGWQAWVDAAGPSVAARSKPF